jgi:hypothetical protein
MVEALKVCRDCGQELPLSDFVRDARRQDGHTTLCRRCKSKRVTAGIERKILESFDPRPWHRGCPRCGEYDRHSYPGPKCQHPGAVQGALLRYGRGNLSCFIPEGHERFPVPAPWAKVGA